MEMSDDYDVFHKSSEVFTFILEPEHYSKILNKTKQKRK